MTRPLEEEKELQAIKYIADASLQSNQAAIDAGSKCLSYLFLLNGSAATALLAQSDINLKAPAIPFAFAALWAIAAMAACYFLMLQISESWRRLGPDNDSDIHFDTGLPFIWKTASVKSLLRWRCQLVIFSAIPGIIFFGALIWTATLVW